jgi:superfamily I DNA/RNA helicase
MKRIIIPGPPGTGKTYHLTNNYLRKEIEEYKTPTKKIAYITFSTAAAEESKKRIKLLFPQFDINKDFPYVSTMHTLGKRQLNIDTNIQLLKDEKWNAFKNFSQICRDLSFDYEVNEFGFSQYKNDHMKIIEYARAKKLSILDAATELDKQYSVEIYLTEQIDADLKSYKEQTGMVEFSDMIKQFIEKDKCPPLSAVFLDEAQDLNPLQWDMFNYIESKCERSYVAGDDDQTIYTFQGADENIFINLKGEMDPRIESRRVPRAVHKVALSILDNIENRMIKTWLPRDAEGKVYQNESIENLDFSKGEWMIIARTNKMLYPIKDYLISLNLRFDSKINDLLPYKLLEAYRVWVRLNKGATVGAEEAKVLYNYLTVKDNLIKPNFSTGKSLDAVDYVDIDDLMMDHGLLVTGSWEQLKIKENSKLYIKSLLDNGDDLLKKSRIKISTIHGVKGEECENVILYTGMEKIIYDSALRNPDPEHRLFFVGVTRAKENLYIMQPDIDDFYNYIPGDPIL